MMKVIVFALASFLLPCAAVDVNMTAVEIHRSKIIERAQRWVDLKIPYSQSAYFEGYRQDCSGYVSMAWKSSKPGHTTYDMENICDRIQHHELAHGDAILAPPHHVLLFHKWVDDAKEDFMEYAEHQPGTVASHDKRQWSYFHNNGYFACRFKHLGQDVDGEEE